MYILYFHHPLTDDIDTNRIWAVWKMTERFKYFRESLCLLWPCCLFWKKEKEFWQTVAMCLFCLVFPWYLRIPKREVCFRELGPLIIFWGKQLIQPKPLKMQAMLQTQAAKQEKRNTWAKTFCGMCQSH